MRIVFRAGSILLALVALIAVPKGSMLRRSARSHVPALLLLAESVARGQEYDEIGSSPSTPGDIC